MIRLSILDQSTISEGSGPVEALAQTGRMAREAERMGYQRFWVSEHHFSANLAGSSPEVLISHLAAVTSTLRIGSGGVMLPHYSSYKVAENFRVLEGLYPGRIDLGLGRAPGGMPLATQALQEGKVRNVERYAEQIADLNAYLTDTLSPSHPFAGLVATPLVRTVPQMWMLGSSGGSAAIAAQQGTGFAFAQFINGSGGADIMRWYQENFRPSAVMDRPKSMVAIFAVCAESEEEAHRVASSMDLSLLLLEKGGSSGGTPSIERALSYPYSPYDQMRVLENRKRMIVGSPEQIKRKIESLCAAYRTDEVMITSIIHRFEDKLKSFRLIAEAFGLSNMA
ncbi:LLM class flavin-dependent oxidoreductase [Paenibacillus sp.]|jgi:luciferase family oxidoreductase group 1|uniref:LLM class flavin-dependent oxidoreductase n=1 Tax=Paenibacillus sp. TaxID=58172 RepID=UPI0028170B8C|nr:LLM class flavin-dependent oxidoreductase [Paenibacillus sp.]MDR0267108.1 LLM class flavin-dependent oxidoreductase [Paenibacillus sp.]